jgi:5-methylcytosine-specific restriction endonuclease McrA
MSEPKTYNCLSCGKENLWKGHSYRNKYCNNECQHDYQHRERIKIWFETGQIGAHVAKRYLLEKTGCCAICGITSWNEKEIVFDLDHIDGNSQNNRPENLRLLCPNCHSQTDTYKARNTGNGRHARRQRYAKGKSF